MAGGAALDAVAVLEVEAAGLQWCTTQRMSRWSTGTGTAWLGRCRDAA